MEMFVPVKNLNKNKKKTSGSDKKCKDKRAVLSDKIYLTCAFQTLKPDISIFHECLTSCLIIKGG